MAHKNRLVEVSVLFDLSDTSISAEAAQAYVEEAIEGYCTAFSGLDDPCVNIDLHVVKYRMRRRNASAGIE